MQNNKLVTILTPTFNRSHLLTKLFDSLCNQTNYSFEWIVIDDGSTDNTKQIVDSFSNSNFEIKYYKKENGGKHTALNFAYKYVNTPLIFIVDSDDFLTTDAVQQIIDTYNNYKNEKNICGFSFLRKKPNGEYLSTAIVPYNGLKESYVKCRINRNIQGDMAEVWYTDCLKEYKFPEFENEKFLGEDIVWVKMSEKYQMLFFNIAIYISDYREDGLTKNRRHHNILSPVGCMERAKAFLDSKCNIIFKLKSAMQYTIYGKFAKKTYNELFVNSKHKFLFIITFLPSVIMYNKWKKYENRGS